MCIELAYLPSHLKNACMASCVSWSGLSLDAKRCGFSNLCGDDDLTERETALSQSPRALKLPML